MRISPILLTKWASYVSRHEGQDQVRSVHFPVTGVGLCFRSRSVSFPSVINISELCKRPPFLAKDLIKKLLKTDAAERITIEQTMQHKWITHYQKVDFCAY